MAQDYDWQSAVREQLRRETGPLIFSGVLLTFFGWMGGAWILPAGGIQLVASLVFIWALKVGGPLFLVLAAVSWTGWRIWLLVDGVGVLAVGAALALFGVVSLLGGIGFNALMILFAGTFFVNGYRLVNLYLQSAGVNNWGVVPIINEDVVEVPPRDALTYEGKSLAAELMTRTKGNLSQRNAALPTAEPLRRPDEDDDEDEDAPVYARPAQSATPAAAATPKPAAPRRIMVRCMHSDCGALNEEHALVCSNCGRPLTPDTAQKPQSPAPAAPAAAAPKAAPPKPATPPTETRPPAPAPPPKLENAPDGFLAALADDDDD